MLKTIRNFFNYIFKLYSLKMSHNFYVRSEVLHHS